ncbi:hypothetical protein [Mycoplasma sp. 1012]
MEEKKNKKFSKKLAAIIALAFGGAVIGSGILAPFFIFKNWKEIQYDVIDIEQNFSKTTDSSVAFDFAFSDEQTYKLNGSDIHVSLMDADKNVVQTGVAKYVDSLRKWSFDSTGLAQKLQAGKRYEISFDTDNRSITKEKKKFNVLNEDKKVVVTKANVSEFVTNSINSREQKVTVKFADEIKSLDGKKAILKYHYTTTQEGIVDPNNQDKDVKNEETRISFDQAVEIKDGQAEFIIKGLQPARKYTIEYVAIVDEKDYNGIVSQREITVPYSVEAKETFNTPAIKLEVNTVQTIKMESNTGQISVGFLKSNDEPEISLIGKQTKLKYKIKGTSEVKEITSTVIGNSSIFDFNGSSDAATLKEGTEYEIISVEAADSSVQFKESLLNDAKKPLFFSTKEAVSAITFAERHAKEQTFTIDINSQNNKANLDGASIEVSLEPFNDKAIEKQVLTKKAGTEDVYSATFKATQLLQGLTYKIAKVKITLKDSTDSFNLPFNYAIEQNDALRSFTTIVGEADLNIQGYAKTSHNSASVNLVYSPENNFLSGKTLVLNYKKTNPASDEVFTSEAVANALKVTFDLGGDTTKINENPDGSTNANDKVSKPLDSGATYTLLGVKIKDTDEIKTKLKADNENQKTFTTSSRIKQIQAFDITDTSVKLKITFADALKTILQTTTEDGTVTPSHRKAKILYQVNNTKEGQETLTSTPISTNLVEITEEGVTYTLNNLLKGVEYQVTGIQFDIELPTFYGREVSSRQDNSFTTTAKQFDVQKIEFENEHEKSADIKLFFDLNSDIVLVNKKVDIYFKEAENTNAPEKHVVATIDELGQATGHASDLEEGKKYLVTKVMPHIEAQPGNETLTEADFNYVIPATITENNKTFYTKPAVLLITRTNLSENSATFDFNFVNSDPSYLTSTAKIKVVYTSADGISSFVEQDLTAEQFNTKKVTLTFNNLEKVTSYTIDKVTIANQEVPRITGFNEELNKFTTPSSTAKVISSNQITNGDTDVTFELGFDNVVDKFMDTKSVDVTLTKDNSSDTVVARGTVESGILRIHAQNLEAGTKYNITAFALSEGSTDNISVSFADSVQANNRFIFTRPLVNNFDFQNVSETSATVVVHFADSQNNYNNKHVILSILNKENNAVTEINSSSLTSGSQTIANKQITFALSNLSKFTPYEVVGIKVDTSGNNFEDITIKSDITKTFNTTATNVAVERINTEDITKNSAKVTYVFNNIDAYLNTRTATLHYTVANGSEQTATATISNTLGVIHADFNLTNLEEGASYTANRITIDNIQNITNYTTTFFTLGVVQNVVATTVNEQNATITVHFTNADTTNTFNNKKALIKFASAANGTLKTAQATINNNSATFSLENLDKNTKYILQDVSIELDPARANDFRIIDLDKSFTTENQEQRIRDFTTKATSATVISIIEDNNNKTKSSTSVTFQFDRVVDAFLADKSATLTYINKKDGSSAVTTATTATVSGATNSLTFDLSNLEEGAGFTVQSINIDGVAINFADSVTKDFSTLPVVSGITPTIPANNDSDTNIGLNLTFGDGLHSLNGKHASISISSATNGSQTLYTSEATIANNSVYFNLTNLDKNNQFVIDEVIVDGVTIEFNTALSDQNNAARKFKTTAKEANVTSLQTLEASKDSVLLSINFDINKDWYLVNKKAKLKFTKESETFETTAGTINDEGSLIINVNNTSLLENKTLSAGTGYTLTEVVISENNDTNTTISLSNLTENNKKDNVFSTLSTINAIAGVNGSSTISTTENSAQIKITLQTQDTTLVNKKAFVHVVNNSTNAITTVESTANFNASNEVEFNVTGLPKNDTYTVLGISIGSQNAQILEYETTVAESAKTFRTQPTSATVTGISYKWLDTNKSKALVTLSFDADVDSFMNGKALKLTYKKVAPNDGPHSGNDVITVAKEDGQDIIVRGSTIKFIMQGKVDENGNQVDHGGTIHVANNTNVQTTTKAFKGLILGSKYQLETLQTVNTNDNITINFANTLTESQKQLITPDGVYSYKVGTTAAEGNVVGRDGVSIRIQASVSSQQDLEAINRANPGNIQTNTPGAIKIRFFNIATGKYEELGVNRVAVRDYNTYWIEFAGKLSKESRYKIANIVINGVSTVEFPYDGSNNLGDYSYFNTNSNYATVTDIEYGEKTKTSAKISIGFAKSDENLLRNHKEIVVSYREVGTTGDAQTITRQIDPNTKKLELTINNLQPGKDYEITDIKVNAKKLNISNTPFPEFHLIDSTGRIEPADKTFSTLPVIDQVTTSAIDERSAQVTVRLQGDVSDIDTNASGILVLNKANKTSDVSAYNTAQNVHFDPTAKTITFNLSNLEKNTLYNIVSLTIGDNTYDWLSSVQDTNKQFTTTGTTATITNISYSNIVNQSATVRATIANVDSYTNGKNLKVKYKLLDENNSETGSELSSNNVTINNNTAEFTLNNLKNGQKYRIIGFANEVNAGEQSVAFTMDNGVNKEFSSYVGIKEISSTTQEESASITVTFKDYEPSRVVGKLAILRLQNFNEDIFATVNDQQEATFTVRNLAKETQYTIETIKIDNNTLSYYDTVQITDKQFTTLGTTATITSISSANNTTSAVNVTVQFALKDKYLSTKSVKLYYKEADDNASTTAKTNATAATVTLNRNNIATATFALNGSDVTSGKKYEVLGVKSQPSEDTITFSISDTINVAARDTKFFETKISRPTISSARIVQTTNPEGNTNTFLSQVELVFNDPNDALNTNLINSWNFKLKNDKSGSEQEVSGLKFINRSFTRDSSNNTTTVTFYIEGDVLQWAARTNKLEVDFSYFDNLDKTNSTGTGTYISTLANGTSTMDITTQENFVTTSLSGVITTGNDMEFHLKVYDPKNILTNFGQENGAYGYRNGDNAGRNILSLSNATTGNAIDFKVKAKQSLINLRANDYSVNWKDNSSKSVLLDNNPVFWYNDGQTKDATLVQKWKEISIYNRGVFPDGDKWNRNYESPNGRGWERGALNVDKWKYRSEGRDWVNITEALRKEVLYIHRNNDNIVDIKLRITAGNDTEFLIAKIINFDLNDFKITNEKSLFAINSSTIWQNYQSPLYTGSKFSFAGTSYDDANNIPQNDRWRFNAGPSNFNPSTGQVDQSYIALKDSIYDEATGKIKGIIHLPTTARDSSKKLHALQSKADNQPWDVIKNTNTNGVYAFALFINSQGDEYIFGDKNGQAINLTKDLIYKKDQDSDDDYKTAEMTFDLRGVGIPEDQLPQEGEKLRFVNFIVTFSNTWEQHTYPFNWLDTSKSYKEIVYKK